MKTRTLVWVVLGFALAALIGAWLMRSPTSSPSSRGVPVESKVAADRAELRIGLAGLGDLNTLDPLEAGTTVPILIVWQMYERLVGVDNDGNLVPMLATSWSHTPDLREWRFRLRTHARFHASTSSDGDAVTPIDVKSSIQRALKTPGFAQTLLIDLVVGAQDYADGKATDVAGLETEADQVIFRLVRPFAFLPERLASSFLSIVPARAARGGAEPPPGSGPYRFVSWDRKRNRVTLNRVALPNQAEASGPARLTFFVFENEAVAVQELKRGTIDWLETTSAALPLVNPQEPGVQLYVETNAQLDIRLVAANQEREPFNRRPEIALALNQATDRQQLVRTLGGGRGISGPVPEGPGIAFNPRRARALVQRLPPEARSLNLLVQPGTESRVLAELLKQQWEQVGFVVTLTPGLANFFDILVAGDYQMALAYYGPFVPVAEQYLWPYRKAAQPIPNAMRFSSEAFEAAFNRYAAAVAIPERRQALDEVNRILLARPPVVWLVQAPQVAAHRVNFTFSRWSAMPVFSRPINSSN